MFFHLINRHFGHPRPTEERASDLLAGGIYQHGHQCGMLWGASMAIGAEAHRRYPNQNQSVALAIKATQHMMDSFISRTNYHNCYDIVQCNWKKKGSILKYFISGKVAYCFRLAEKWAPEAIQSAIDGLELHKENLPGKCLSCTCEVARKMGANEEQVLMVAGFAGGIGLSGNGCGALATAIWLNTMTWYREHSDKVMFTNPYVEHTMKVFLKETRDLISCREITARTFETTDEHTEFIARGGCKELINVLAETRFMPEPVIAS